MVIEWDEEKNELLKQTRGICFEQIKAAIEEGRFIGPEINPSRENQMRIVVKIDDYPVAVPFVEMEDGGWFLKTAYFSRKDKGRL